jgi:hypothetical protein
VAGVLLTAVVGLVLGTALGWAIDRPVKADSGPVTEQPRGAAAKASVKLPRARKRERRLPAASDPGTAATRQRAALRRALLAGRRKAEAMGGTVEAAVMAPGWSEPVVVGDGGRYMRMWSMAKPVTAVALRLTMGDAVPREVELAMRGALTRSENCAQRRVILELKRQSGGPREARRALSRVLKIAGGGAHIEPSAVPPAPDCRNYLVQHGADLKNPLAPALQLGVSEWTVRDAVSFASALMNGRFDDAGEAVLAEMKRPKAKSREVPAGQLKMDPAFGAGKAIPGAFYKAGWGGVDSGDYLAGQLGILPDRSLAFAVMFHPAQQPPSEDPGLTAADEAIQAVVRPVAKAMR